MPYLDKEVKKCVYCLERCLSADTNFGVKAYNINGDCMIITTCKWRNNGIVLLHVNKYKIVQGVLVSIGCRITSECSTHIMTLLF